MIYIIIVILILGVIIGLYFYLETQLDKVSEFDPVLIFTSVDKNFIKCSDQIDFKEKYLMNKKLQYQIEENFSPRDFNSLTELFKIRILLDTLIKENPQFASKFNLYALDNEAQH